MDPRLDVAIIGAGIHGCAIAVRLLNDLPALQLRLIDPSGGCLSEWTRRTRGQGMETMRSPGAHHIDLAPESLLHHASLRGRERELYAPYHRPSLDLFLDHCGGVIRKLRLDRLMIRGWVNEVEAVGSGYRLKCSAGRAIHSRFLVLAPGLRGQERDPQWALPLLGRGVTHVESFDLRQENLASRQVLVVGGGLSAATLSDAAIRRGARVTLVSRHPLEARLFDVDPGWVGPKYLRAFHAEPRPEARRRMIRQARGRGSVTPEIFDRLKHHRTEGRLRILEEEAVLDAQQCGEALEVKFRRAGKQRFDRVFCCTGFEPRLQNLGWLGPLREVPDCDGIPIVGPTLELRPGCFVSGWLAELELGPAARNIAGARAAAARISGEISRALRAGGEKVAA